MSSVISLMFLLTGLMSLLRPLLVSPAPPVLSGAQSAARWREAPWCWVAWWQLTPGRCGTLGYWGSWPGSDTRSVVSGITIGSWVTNEDIDIRVWCVRGCWCCSPMIRGSRSSRRVNIAPCSIPQQPQPIAQLLNSQLPGNSNHHGRGDGVTRLY